MPHQRPRHLSAIINNFLKASPIVGVLGQRQTGKTTFCSELAKKISSLDREDDLLLCERGPNEFITNQPSPFLIDECQLAPRLFPALKDYVRTHKATGQFLLTGSVRFTSRKAIRESLTGRILLTELLPMTWSECNEYPVNNLITRLHKNGVTSLPLQHRVRAPQNEDIISNYLKFGGLPGICFSRNQSHRTAKYKTHLDTIIDRDLRLIIETSLPKMSLLALISTLARNQGTPLNWEALRRDTGISVQTLKRLFSAFEALFLLRPISLLGHAIPETWYFEDAGMAHYLTGTHSNTLSLTNITHFLFCNLREAYHYCLDTSYSIHTYRTRGGAHIPLIFDAYQAPLAIIPSLDRQPTLSSLRSAESFLKQHAKAQALIVHFGSEARILHSRLASIPWNWLV